MKNLLLLPVMFLLVGFHTSIAQSRAEKERESFITNAKVLERKPFDPNAKAAREVGFKWLVETDQVSVSLCSDMMKLIPEKKNKFKAELLMQFSFGMAVFKLENPDKKDDEKAANIAGLESMLRTYEAMLVQDEKAKNSELDAMISKRGNGEIEAFAAAVYAKCPQK